MRKTKKIKLKPTIEQEQWLLALADNCARLWDEIHYKRIQAFFSDKMDCDTEEEYKRYKHLMGSATAQQIIIKNNEA